MSNHEENGNWHLDYLASYKYETRGPEYCTERIHSR